MELQEKEIIGAVTVKGRDECNLKKLDKKKPRLEGRWRLSPHRTHENRIGLFPVADHLSLIRAHSVRGTYTFYAMNDGC